MKKNQIIELAVTDLAGDGSGVGRFEGMVVFVPMSAPGDLLRVRIVKALSSHTYGIIEEILSPSPDRIAPACPAYRQCGGCDLLHLSYEAELAAKNNWVHQNMRRIGGFALPVLPAVPSPLTLGYRNKAIYQVRQMDGRIAAGFFAKRSHRVIAAESCLLQPSFFADILRIVISFMQEFQIAAYDEQTHSGLVRALFIRWGEQTGQIMVCLVTNGDTLPRAETLTDRLRTAHPGVCSVLQNINRQNTNVILGVKTRILYGAPVIEDILCGLRFALSPHSFYQVNRQAAEKLYRLAADMAEPLDGGLLLDLYCGTGTIGLSMADRAGALIGVEVVPDAVENAKQNAAAAGIHNARFLCADAAEAAARLQAEGLRPRVVILDPPRKGCELSVIRSVAQMEPDRVLMISCNSATAARDAKEFARLGYAPAALRTVDMFPRTAHVETVVLMSRVEGK